MSNYRRRRDAPASREESRHHQKRSRNSRYDNNAIATQYEYFLIYTLYSSSPLDSFDSWLVDSGASRHFTRYREVLSNLVKKETNLKINFGDNSTYHVKVFGFVSFRLDYGDIIHLHDVMHVLRLKKNLVSISALEDKGMRVAFIRAKVLTWPMESHMRDAFTMGSRIKGLYRVNGRPI